MSEVGVAELRRELKKWLDRARAGDEVIVTDRGRPLARLTGVDTSHALERLVEEGLISRPRRRRPRARGLDRVAGSGVSEYVIAEREKRRR